MSEVTVALGRFAVLRCMGRGGMGTVFEARDRLDGARLALKVPRDAQGDALARLKREFGALSELSHPNLLAMYELHVDRGLPFITMELVDGVSLQSHLDERFTMDDASIGNRLLQLVWMR
jgi:eukaryotic-like serine/threonine-protein kinase